MKNVFLAIFVSAMLLSTSNTLAETTHKKMKCFGKNDSSLRVNLYLSSMSAVDLVVVDWPAIKEQSIAVRDEEFQYDSMNPDFPTLYAEASYSIIGRSWSNYQGIELGIKGYPADQAETEPGKQYLGFIKFVEYLGLDFGITEKLLCEEI